MSAGGDSSAPKIRRKTAGPSGTGPTLIIGLGEFGTDVLERLRAAGVGGPAPVRRRQLLIALAPEAELDEQVGAIVAKAETVLGFNAVVQGDPGDERRPTLDMFLVADLGDEAVAKALPELVSEASARLLRRFSNIFPGHDMPNLTICPVVALIGVRGGGDIERGAAIRKGLSELEQRADKVSFRSGDASPVARVFVVEQQSSRYELKPQEVASTVVAFLSLVVGTDLRQQEPLRTFLRSSVDHVRERRLFASFGCATLELSLHRYCVARGAGELVDGVRAAASASVAEHAVTAERLVPDADVIADKLCSPLGGDDLVALLRAHTPHIDFPSIGEHDTPEQVREVAYGWGWFDALESAVQAQVKRLDEREMDEVTRVADERGLKRVRSLQRDVRRELRDAELSGPHGWADALRLAEHIGARAGRQLSELEAELKDEKLPQFPKPTTVESSFRELREESTLRPRPYRMIFFGALAAIVLGALLHYLPKWFVVCIATKKISPFAFEPSSMEARVGAYKYLLDPPYAFFWVALVAGSLIGFFLNRYRVKRHNKLIDARESLQAAVRRYLTDDVGPSVRRYYESRLHFTLKAWALRSLRRVREIADREVERLSAISAALDRLSRDFASEARRAERSAEGEGGDLVYRTHLSAELLEGTYEAARPGADLADKLFAELDKSGATSEVPDYLFETKVREFVAPYTEPSPDTLAKLAGPVVVEFVQRRHGKLGVPLETRGHDERTAEQRYLFAPAWACPPLTELRDELATLPSPQEHADNDRVHLVTVQTALKRESIVLPAPRKEGGA